MKKLEWWEQKTSGERYRALRELIEPEIVAKRAPEFIARHHEIIRHESKRSKKKLQKPGNSGTQDDNE